MMFVPLPHLCWYCPRIIMPMQPPVGPALKIAIDLGLFDCLEKDAKTAHTLAELVGAEADWLRRIIVLLASSAYAGQCAQGFTATAFSQAFKTNKP